MRYQYKHSILKDKLSNEQDSRIGQRLSIIIRVCNLTGYISDIKFDLSTMFHYREGSPCIV